MTCCYIVYQDFNLVTLYIVGLSQVMNIGAHNMLWAESGKLLMFGETEDGKLGLGEDPLEHHTPQEVEHIRGKVVWVACGGSHTVAVTGTCLQDVLASVERKKAQFYSNQLQQSYTC